MPETIENGPVSYSMAPYAGPWTKAEAAHLLRRTMFGPTNQQILNAVQDGMATTVANLLTIPLIDQPLTYDPAETVSSYGTTWVTSVYPSDAVQAQLVDTARLKSLGAWSMRRINTESVSILEKMCLFWQNHFAASNGPDQRSTYNYHMLFYTHALGNFKQLVKDITIDPNMLFFLNGGTNTFYSPNENYARELLELFSIGKGDQIGDGDYSNYTELDVASGAKILTGYIVDGWRSDTLPSPQAVFQSLLHDGTSKTLSYHFGGVTIPNNGATEYSDYIDVIFQQDEVAYFMARNVYRYFVNYDLTADVETNVIPVMAQTLIDNNYEFLPMMSELLQSDHFYDVALRGSVIRSPLEMIFGLFNITESRPNFDLTIDSDMYLWLYSAADNLGQAYAAPPSVAGWSAYYQEPSFTKLWVNATHLKNRFGLGLWVTLLTGIPVGGENLKIDALGFVDNMYTAADTEDAANPTDVINGMCDVFFPKAVSATKKATLKFILVGGVNDSDWTNAYSAYLADPLNETVAAPVRNRIQQTLAQIVQMPEFQTI